MVYKKEEEEEIFNKIFTKYFIKTESLQDICYIDEIKNIYKLYVDKKNIGINSFLAYLIKKGCVKKGTQWMKLLINSDMKKIIEQTNSKKEQLKIVQQKIQELKMIENKLLGEILNIKSEMIDDDEKIILDYKDKTIHIIDYMEHELVKIIYCQNSKVYSFSPLFINLVELYCSKCLYIKPDIDLSIYSNLSILDISHSSVSVLYPMNNIKYLNCEYTDIQYLPDMPNLEYLYINNTHIEKLNEGNINVKELYCSNTLITSIPETYSKLKKLYCDNDYIELLSDNFVELVELSIDNTNIINIPNTFIQLKKLICSKTNMRELSDKLINLEYIDINNTPRFDDDISWEEINGSISSIPITYKKLKYLNIKNTKITIDIKNYPELESLE